MKKTVKLYTAIWVVLVATFNVIAFVVPAWKDTEKYTAAFFIGYGLIMATLVAQLAVVYIFANKMENGNVAFLRLSTLNVSYTALLASVIAGAVCMIFTFIPAWVAAIVSAIMLAIFLVSVLKTEMAVAAVQSVGQKYHDRSIFMRTLTEKAEALKKETQVEELSALTKKVYEGLRYSDPMSCDGLQPLEGQLEEEFAAFAQFVRGEDVQKATETAKKLLSIIDARNVQCKLLKK